MKTQNAAWSRRVENKGAERFDFVLEICQQNIFKNISLLQVKKIMK